MLADVAWVLESFAAGVKSLEDAESFKYFNNHPITQVHSD